MTNQIKVGKVLISNPNTKQVILTIPQGMTGAALIRWKLRHKDELQGLGVSVPDGTPTPDEGDRFSRAGGM